MADDLVITTNEPDNLTFLHQEFPQLNIQLVCDIFSSRGALPGLYTALQAARNPYVAIVACDMVFASGALVVAEALCMNQTGADVVVPVNKHGFEPFHAMYRRMECRPPCAVRSIAVRSAPSRFLGTTPWLFTSSRKVRCSRRSRWAVVSSTRTRPMSCMRLKTW